MQKMLKEETKITAAYKALQGPTTATTTNGTSAPAPDRTHGSPDWGGEDGPLNFRKALAVTPIAVSEFEANNTFPTFMGCSFIPTVFFSYFSKDKVQDPYHYTKWFKQTPGWKLLQLWHGNLNFRWLGHHQWILDIEQVFRIENFEGRWAVWIQHWIMGRNCFRPEPWVENHIDETPTLRNKWCWTKNKLRLFRWRLNWNSISHGTIISSEHGTSIFLKTTWFLQSPQAPCPTTCLGSSLMIARWCALWAEQRRNYAPFPKPCAQWQKNEE